MGFAMKAKTEWKIGGGGAAHTPDLKSHYLQARATLTAMSVPPRSAFLSAEL